MVFRDTTTIKVSTSPVFFMLVELVHQFLIMMCISPSTASPGASDGATG